jgi:hypothetical protein
MGERATFTRMEDGTAEDWRRFFHHIGPDRDLRERLRGHPHWERTAEFCALYDNPAFDPKAETLPLAEFDPIVRRVVAQPKNSIHQAAAPVTAAARAAA